MEEKNIFHLKNFKYNKNLNIQKKKMEKRKTLYQPLKMGHFEVNIIFH